VTKDEAKYQADVRELGCIICYLQGHPGTPCAIHHLIAGGRRIGEKSVLGLCDPGHHQNPQKGSGKIARHPTKAQFEKAYGTEGDLLRITQSIVERLNETV